MVRVCRSANETHGNGKTSTLASTPQAEDRTPTAYDPVSPASTVGGDVLVHHPLVTQISVLLSAKKMCCTCLSRGPMQACDPQSITCVGSGIVMDRCHQSYTHQSQAYCACPYSSAMMD